MPTYKPIKCSALSQTTSQFRTSPFPRTHPMGPPCKMHTKHTMRTFLALASLHPGMLEAQWGGTDATAVRKTKEQMQIAE